MASTGAVRHAQKPAVSGRLPIVLSLLALVAMGVAYYVGVRGRTAYLVGRDTRLLSSVAVQLNEKLRANRTIVKNFAEAMVWEQDGKPIQSYVRPDGTKPHPLRDYLGEMERLERDVNSQTPTTIMADEKPAPALQTARFEERLIRQNDQLTLEIEFLGQPQKKQLVPYQISTRIRPHATGSVSFNRIVDDIFNQGFLGGFDAIMLVRGDGLVLYQVEPDEAYGRLSGLGPLPRAGARASGRVPDIVLTSLQSLNERTGFNTEAPLSIASLRGQTRRTEVVIGGRAYELMTQPYAFDTAKSDSILAVSDKKKDEVAHVDEWIIAGLVGKKRFMAEATSISTSLVALIAALLMLAACCLPFLKLALLGDTQPVTRTDVALIILALLLGSGVTTMLFVDVIAYKRLQSDADDQQRAYAADMVVQLDKSVHAMIQVADGLQKWSLDHIAKQWKASNIKTLSSVPDVRKQIKGNEYAQIFEYPWFSSFAWIDSRGHHAFRGAMKGGPPPLLNVSTRAYFQKVIDHPFEWHIRDQKGRVESTHKIYLESVRTMTTGRPETVISMPVDTRAAARRVGALASTIPPVFCVTFPFIEFVGVASPPAMSFAIIDDNGNVLYHSDQQRIGLENVFTETDNTRSLRAAVLARHEKFVDTAYWGEDQRILITPLRDVPWTLLTFRNKRLLRTVNLEIIIITVLLLGMNLMLWAGVFLLVSLLRPQYRAAWLWPNEKRAARWRRLLSVLFLTSVAALLVLFFYDLPVRLAVGFGTPIQIVLASYLVLSPPPRRYTYAILGAVWLTVTGALLWTAAWGELQHEMLFQIRAAEPLARVPVLLLLFGAALLVLLPVGDSVTTWRRYVRDYTICGVIGILIVGALPAVAFFHAAHRIKMESLIKYGQLVLAERIERRLDDLVQTSWRDDPEANINSRFYMPYFFESVYQPMRCDLPDCLALRGLKTAQPDEAMDPREQPRDTTAWKRARNRVAEFIDDILPQYSDDSLAMRDLYHGGAADGTWQWRQYDRALALVRPFEHLGQKARRRLFGTDGQPMLVITSRLPRLMPPRLSPDDAIGAYATRDGKIVESSTLHLAPPLEKPMPWSARWIVLIAAAFALVLLIAHVVGVVARKIFVYDVRPTEWLAFLRQPLSGSFGDNLFIVRSATHSVGDIIERRGTHVVLFAELAKQNGWNAELRIIDGVPAGRNILCEDFEQVVTDSNVAAKALSFLEKLVQLPNRSVVVISSVSPALIPSSGSLAVRWSSLMASFVSVDERQLLPLPVPAPPKPRLLVNVPPRFLSQEYRENDRALFVSRVKGLLDRMAAAVRPVDGRIWLKNEAGTHNHLALLANEIQCPADATVDEVADDFTERATPYYTALWSGCSPAEKLMLHQIAQYGFVNGNNRRMLRRLMARGLVRRDADLRLFNETFRWFVLSRAQDVENEDIAVEEQGPWDRLRVPLFVVLFALVAFFFATQKDLVNATSAILTGLAAGLPALLKLVGLFTERKGAVAASQ